MMICKAQLSRKKSIGTSIAAVIFSLLFGGWLMATENKSSQVEQKLQEPTKASEWVKQTKSTWSSCREALQTGTAASNGVAPLFAVDTDSSFSSEEDGRTDLLLTSRLAEFGFFSKGSVALSGRKITPSYDGPSFLVLPAYSGSGPSPVLVNVTDGIAFRVVSRLGTLELDVNFYGNNFYAGNFPS